MQFGMTCSTPIKECSGTITEAGNGRGVTKWHRTSLDVHNCYGKYLQSQGYTKLSRRTFRSPDGGPILVLSKNPGIPVIGGKRADKQAKGRPMGKPHQVNAF